MTSFRHIRFKHLSCQVILLSTVSENGFHKKKVPSSAQQKGGHQDNAVIQKKIYPVKQLS